MRRTIDIILTTLTLLSATACVVDFAPKSREWTALERSLGLDEPEIPVRLGFDLPFEQPRDAATKGSMVGGVEDADDYVKSLHMVCFTKEGICLGYREARLDGDEQTFNDLEGVTCQGRELFVGSVPARTARIHFLANVDANSLPNNSDIGSNENTLMHSARTSVTAAHNRRICYWGFHGEGSSEAMREWLAAYDSENDVYNKIEGHNVHLVRDRARVQLRNMFDYNRNAAATVTVGAETYSLEPHVTDYTIESIDWVITNGLNQGYLAPYCLTAEDHFDAYLDSTRTPAALKSDRLTPYDRADASRYVAVEDSLVRVYTKPASGEPYQGTIDAPLFLFEDLGDPSDPPKIILKVVYGTSTGVKTKYHVLLLLDDNKQPRSSYRNHNYILDIYGLPWQGVGYSSFADALAGVNYSNNLTVSIADEVQMVNNGLFSLEMDETYLMYQSASDEGQYKTVGFTYKAVGAGETTTGIDASNFTVGWKLAAGTQVEPTFASPTVSIVDFQNDGATITGKIQFQIGTSISDNLQSGVIELSDAHSGFTRFVHVCTITKFSFLPSGVASLRLTATGGGRTVNGVACPTYTMTIRVPGDFPSGFYPLRIRMATTTLQPYQVIRTDVDGTNAQAADTDITVLMEGTENGTVLEGETLYGMNFVTTSAADWNSRATGSPWDYWYTYRIVSKPTITSGAGSGGVTVEDTGDKLYTFYFDDIRGFRTQAAPTGVGLFLKIRYFGEAVTVQP